MMARAGGGWWGVLACGLILVALAGCGGGVTQRHAWVDPNPLPADTQTVATPEIGEHGGRFVLGQSSSPKTFNAVMANETSSTDVNNLLYASLNDWDYRTHEDYGQLARGWDVSADGLTYTFHLRHGLRFSDGHPLTSEDVKFSYDVAMDPTLHPAVQDLMQNFQFAAPDSYTFVVKVPTRNRLALGAIGSVRVLPKHVLEPAFKAGSFASAYSVATPPESLVTSGAWRLKEFKAGERTVVERNPYWFRVDAKGQRLPYLDEVVFLIVPDQAAAALKFQAGEIDAVDNVRNEDYRTYETGQKRGNYTVYDLGPSLNTNLLWFNLNKVKEAGHGKKVGEPWVEPYRYAWFNNASFRRAVSLAIDRDAIIRGTLFGDGVKNWSNATPGNKDWYFDDPVHYDHDPAAAAHLLDSLGFKDRNGDGVREDAQGHDLSFTLKTNSDNLMRVSMANFVRDDLAKVGIKVVNANVDFNTLITNYRQDFQYDAMLLGQQSGVPPDPPAMGQNFWRPSGMTHYWNIKQDHPATPAEAHILDQLEKNLMSMDRDGQMATWKEMQNTLNREAFVIYLPIQIVKVPVRNTFGNVMPNIIPHRLLWNIEWVYAKPGRARA